ncbi:hypothetical protein IIC38_04410 [candidate division KSB1 bacterium]|nr:hypothetical protein [candidate division KSB1 bacterium]
METLHRTISNPHKPNLDWRVILALLAACTMSCNWDFGTVQPERVWMATEPIQCLGNPWELDWLESHNWNYSGYPKDHTTIELEPEEFAIIQDFYNRRGVTVFKAETVQKYDTVCAACFCPEGHTLYLIVAIEDVQKMIEFGYRIETP